MLENLLVVASSCVAEGYESMIEGALIFFVGVL
jgi:hypothetical protein